jgi:putative ABC transport system permease protein
VRFADIFQFALSALSQQKVRTVLTTLGVTIASFVLVLSLSLGKGVQETITGLFRRHHRLRQIEVFPGWDTSSTQVPAAELKVKGHMSDAKRQRLRQAIRQRWIQQHGRKPRVELTRQFLRRLEQIEHVQTVIPTIQAAGWAVLPGGADQSERVVVSTAAPDDEHFRRRIVGGRFFASPAERAVVVSEFLLYRWGIADDAAVRRVLGRRLRLEFHHGQTPPSFLLTVLGADREKLTRGEEKVLAKAVGQLRGALDHLALSKGERATLRKLIRPARSERRPSPPVHLAREYTIVGVLRLSQRGDPPPHGVWGSAGGDVLLPNQTAEQLFARLPYTKEHGFDRVTVVVDGEEHVKEVTEVVSALGLSTFSLVDVVERMRTNAMLISIAMAFVAVVALVVSVLGIINTMLMAVLERTREIGVMKAVGARDSHISLVFLVEGALVGLVGGGLGLLLAWAASFPGDALGKSIMEKQAETPLEASLFAFPAWVVCGVPLFVCLMTTLAALLPARRAARVNPITALRHE